jgi:sulfite reductase (ferredoxin)
MFRLPDEVKDGVKEFKASLADLRGGKINPARFTGIRVPWGTYSHRGGKVFMNRLRIPAGQVSAAQLQAIARAARDYGKGKVHLTTRQDIQIHEIQLEDTIKVIEYLKDFDLSPRGGGGNTVRNITACVFSGVCKDEVFDVRNDVFSLTEHFLRQDTSFNLPRKLKFSFSGCAKDCAGCLVHDAGLLAREKDGKRGFTLFVGGGMGSEPLLGHLLEEFIAEEDVGYCIQAIKNIFYKKGDRRNKHHNRLRFLIKDSGFDNFKKLYSEELTALKESEYISLRKIDIPVPRPVEGKIPDVADEEFRQFVKYSVSRQKQRGLVAIELRIPRGDISADNLDVLASLAGEFQEIEFRVSQNQNLLICNIAETDTYTVFKKIKGILSEFLYPSTLLDVVCCKGALTCNLGLCNSPGLTEQVEKVILDNFVDTPAFRKLNIKINGCPNACGHHPVGLIAMHGMVRRVQGRPVPFYKLLLGGRKALENTRLAKDTGILIPARNVPLFLKDFIGKINAHLSEDTDIYEFIDGKAEALANDAAKEYSYVPAYSEHRDFYIDWGKTEEFSLDGLGPGECGKGVLDMIEADLSDAKLSLERAEKGGYLIPELKKALFFSARALLIVKGVDPKTEEAALLEFVNKFVKEGVAGQEFSNLPDFYKGLNESFTLEEKEHAFVYVKGYFEHIRALYTSMDSALNFPKLAILEPVKEENAVKIDAVLDLKGVRCPMNYVQTKLYLENIEVGQIIELCLDEGEPIKNVPASLKNDGQEIIEIKKSDGFYKVKVKKLV